MRDTLILSEIKALGGYSQISTVIPGLGHEHAVGTQGNPVTNNHTLQHNAGDSQQIVVTNGDATLQVGRRHQAIETADVVIMPDDDMVIDQVEIAQGHVTRDHAMILDDIPLSHDHRLLINQE